MSSTTKQSLYLRIVVIVVTVALIFSMVFFTYNLDNLPTFGMSLISQSSPTNCPLEKTAENIDPQVNVNEQTILIWMWPSGNKFELSCAPFNITGCFLTDDKSLYSKADAVMFHHGDIHSDLSGMPTDPRPIFQKWVWYNMDSPTISGKIPGLNNLFNHTCSYRRDSDIFTPYGSLVPISEEDEPFTGVPKKDKLVCWIVRNWNPNFERVKFYTEFKKYIEIKTYGSAFGEDITDEQYIETMKSCKFYLSFENAIHKDYITENFFRPLEHGTVPVVLGPPRQNYELHAPGNAFIHVEDFPSHQELAEKLKHLDQHPDEYMAYFEWRNSFRSVMGNFGLEQICKSCHYLQMRYRHQSFQGLNTWYWV